MCKFIRTGVLLTLGILAPAGAWTQTLTVGASGITGFAPDTIAVSGTSNTRVEVTCSNVDCGKLRFRVVSSAGLAPAQSSAGNPNATTVTLATPMLKGQTTGTLEVVSAGKQIGAVPLTASTLSDGRSGTTAGSDADTVDLGTESLGSLLTADCRQELAPWEDSVTYAPEGNWARFVVTPVGNVLFRPGDQVDEDDRVHVVVVGDARLIPRLKVTRQSPFRTPGALNMLGAGSKLPFDLKGDEGCETRVFLLSDFAPGQGEVKIAVVNDDGGQTTVGGFDFGVHTLYSGAFSLGAIRTELRDPTFGAVPVGGDTVLTQTENGMPRVLYMLSYTPFVWGKRDIEKPVSLFQHLNPMIGVVLSDIRNNAVLGVSADLLNSVYLQGGVHAGRVTRLDPRSGLELGDRFTRPASEIPTVTEWNADWFVGASLDLRAAVELLRIAVTGSGGGE